MKKACNLIPGYIIKFKLGKIPIEGIISEVNKKQLALDILNPQELKLYLEVLVRFDIINTSTYMTIYYDPLKGTWRYYNETFDRIDPNVNSVIIEKGI